MSARIVLDFDDPSEVRFELDYLFRLKAHFPKFKVTLFSPPAMSSSPYLAEIKKLDWIELAVHGWEHKGAECLEWSKQEALNYLRAAKRSGFFVGGFKAPHWSISGPVYEACREEGFWVADNWGRDSSPVKEVPKDNKVYFENGPFIGHDIKYDESVYKREHGHISFVPAVNNDIKLMMMDLQNSYPPESEFIFISELIKELYP